MEGKRIMIATPLAIGITVIAYFFNILSIQDTVGYINDYRDDNDTSLIEVIASILSLVANILLTILIVLAGARGIL